MVERTHERDSIDPDKTTSYHARRAARGEEASLSWVVARFSPLLLAQATYRLGPLLRTHYDPEDVVHDVWAVALPRLAELPERDGRYTPVLLRFLATTLTRRISNLVRRHIREQPPEEEPGRSLPPLEQDSESTNQVVKEAIRQETRGVVLSAIEGLEPREREILVLRGIEQVPNETVAMLLSLTPQAVAMRYRRALDHLRGRIPRAFLEEVGLA